MKTKISSKGHDEDYDLVVQCQKGNKKAVGDLILKYQQKVFDQCYWLLLNRDDAEDAAQEVFVKVMENIKEFEGKSKFSTWLYTITRNHCFNQLKRLRRIKPIDNKDQEEGLTMINHRQKHTSSFYNPTKESEVEKCVRGKLEQLDAKDREVIALVHLQGNTYERAAEVIGCPIGTIRSRLNRALKRLKPELKKCYELLE